MARRAERRRRLREHRRRRTGATGSSGRKRVIVFGALALVVVAVVVYLLWPAVGAPVLAFDKLQVDLGHVPRNQEGVQTFLVVNRGSVPLTIGPVRLQVEEGCDQVSIAANRLDLAAEETDLLAISFGRHRELGPHRVLVHVPSNAPKRPSTKLSIRFVVDEEEAYRGTGPRLRVDKELIDIGAVPYDWPLYEQFTLRNDGDAPLVLEGEPEVQVEEGC